MKLRGALCQVFLFFVMLTLINLTDPKFALACLDDAPPGVKFAPCPKPKPGSWWKIKGLTDGLITLIELKGIGGGKFAAEVNGRAIEFTDEWNRTEDPEDYKTIRDKYDPHNRFLSFPLYPGKTWGGIIGWVGRRGLMKQGTVSVWGQGLEWEEIEVQAGVFESIPAKVLIAGNEVTCWYAPAAQRLAKCRSLTRPSSNFDLIEFYLAE